MKYPAVPLISFVIGMVISVSAWAQPVTWNQAIRGNRCNNGPDFTRAFRDTWTSIGAEPGPASPNRTGVNALDAAVVPPATERESCRQFKLAATSCCPENAGAAGWDGTTCRTVMRNQNAATFGGNATPDWDSARNPMRDPPPTDELAVTPPTGAGAHEVRLARKNNHDAQGRRSARMGGMCQAIGRACAAACGAAATECSKAITGANRMCEQSVQEFANAASILPGDTASRPPGGPGSSPSPSPGGSPGGQQPAGTQKPQAAGGSPLDQLAKAMQAMQQQQQQPQPQPNPNNDPTQQNCEANPALAGCPVKKAEDDSWNKKQATAELKDEKDPASAGGDEFNVASNESNNPAYSGNGEQKFGTPATNGTIANGGGQIPGGGASGTASLGGSQGGYAAASKAATDIMHGMMSGGYSSMNAAMQMQNGASGGGFSGYGAQGGDGFKPNMDLRQFLPGAKNDPTRKLAGGAASFQIQPQTVNIWSRISERIKARCSQGLLRDCN